MPSAYPEREHGLGPAGEPLGPPRAAPAPDNVTPCPNCGCPTLFTIEVDVTHPLVRNSKGVSTYIGCPACPWASPAVVRAV